MKRKTPFQILKAELPLPKQITVDDADGTRLGTNGVYISDIIAIMEKYAEQEVKFISSNLPVSGHVCKHDWEYVGTVNAEYCIKCKEWQDA